MYPVIYLFVFLELLYYIHIFSTFCISNPKRKIEMISGIKMAHHQQVLIILEYIHVCAKRIFQ